MASATTNPTPAPGTAAAAFDKASEVYERMTGGCTREVAKFLLTLDPQVNSSSLILDNACGTGLVTEEFSGTPLMQRNRGFSRRILRRLWSPTLRQRRKVKDGLLIAMVKAR
jgi:hypothetical protein